jgi:phage shock protein A
MNQQLINQIEIKIKQTQDNINGLKSQISTYESTLQSLIRQLEEIKLNIKEKKEVKNPKESRKGLNKTN